VVARCTRLAENINQLPHYEKARVLEGLEELEAQVRMYWHMRIDKEMDDAEPRVFHGWDGHIYWVSTILDTVNYIF
jgi:hypothetical protein